MNSKNHAVDTQSSTFLRYLFIVTLCSSAFLLFLIQPMFTKLVLPLLGGAPAVWNTAMIFFQSALLAGYLYAHLLSSAFKLRNQIIIHLFLMTMAILFLPITIPVGYETPSESWPTIWLLGLFTVAIGLPFFIISANAPLLQSWFRFTRDKDSHDPYFLYAASNIGSISALIAYPLFIEIKFGLITQTLLWSYGFVGLLILILICGISLKNTSKNQSYSLENQAKNNNESPPKLKNYCKWVILAFVPSSLLLSVTNKITTDLISTPLLWVIPLALYLLTFVIVFSRNPIIPHKIITSVAPYCLIATAFLSMSTTHAETIFLFVIGNLSSFFLLALYCHGLLAKARPNAKYLTNFYIAMSFGGVLGGIFIAIIAPLIFSNIYEYALLLATLGFMMPVKAQTAIEIINKRIGKRAHSYLADFIFSITVLGLIILVQQLHSDAIANKLVTIAILTILFLLLLESTGRPLRLTLCIIIGLFIIPYINGALGKFIFEERSFFGVYTVKIENKEHNKNDLQAPEIVHVATHGTTVHGIQIPGNPSPLSYYHNETGLGNLFESYKINNKAIKTVASIGLGTGTTACYRQPGQKWTFFEIDPLVETMARNTELFTYMNKCAGNTDVIIGDARLSLRKIPNKSYDLLIADAFSSDAIPVHLLTKEAFELYKNKIKDSGVIILHVSNRYFELEHIVTTTAKVSNLKARVYHYERNKENAQKHPYRFSASWIAMAQSTETLDDLIPLGTHPEGGGWQELIANPTIKPWTDDYSNVLSALK
ncbi:spermidine synthase [Kiloniella majae]|uniref:spermidine synthase n=1 Tax=Kiloniella majae TaxID=1938558 RepID=UPI000F79A784|nr:fused MFS/spermidine synthase [Kiloniella majae]